MACEICGRSSCTRSFHDLDDQSRFDEVADNVKDRIKETLKCQIERLDDTAPDESVYMVSREDVLNIIDSYS